VIGATAVYSLYNLVWDFVLFWYGRLAAICLVYLLSYSFLRSILSVYSLTNVTGKRNAQASEMRTFAKTYLYT
jgi:hypothetical protein